MKAVQQFSLSLFLQQNDQSFLGRAQALVPGSRELARLEKNDRSVLETETALMSSFWKSFLKCLKVLNCQPVSEVQNLWDEFESKPSQKKCFIRKRSLSNGQAAS